MKKEEIKEEEKEILEIGFGDEINFYELFRVKSKKGLYCLNSKVNQAGMVNMMGFLDMSKKFTVHNSNLICLGQLVFNTYAGNDDININQVFNNLFDKFGEAEVKEYQLADLVPNYDEDKFKDYHAKQVVEWYNEIVSKLKIFKEDEGTTNEDTKKD